MKRRKWKKTWFKTSNLTNHRDDEKYEFYIYFFWGINNSTQNFCRDGVVLFKPVIHRKNIPVFSALYQFLLIINLSPKLSCREWLLGLLLPRCFFISKNFVSLLSAAVYRYCLYTFPHLSVTSHLNTWQDCCWSSISIYVTFHLSGLTDIHSSTRYTCNSLIYSAI
jgi:hypothetical protein